MSESDGITDFVKALRLLHSRAKDSADILKSMLDDVLKNRSNTQLGHKLDQKKPIKAIETAVIKSSSDYKKELFDKKSNIERMRSESFEYPLERKRMRLESPQTSRSTSSSPTPGTGLPLPLKPSLIQSVSEEKPSSVSIRLEEDSEATDIEDENTDAGEFAVVMGLACVQCKQIDIAPNNQLVECQECHNLYHQECHKPPLIDQDVSDPRFVWYCAKCQKTMKKIAVKPTKNTNKSPVQITTSATTSIPSKDVSTSGTKTPVKGDNNSDPRLIPFKREVKVPNPSFQSSSVSSSSSAKPIGLAALANISRTGSVSTTASANNKSKNGNNNNLSTSSAMPPISSSASFMASAEKRLQNLKKNKNKK